MEGKEKIYSCKEYDVYKDNKDGSMFAYDQKGIFITCICAYIRLKHFKMIVEDILLNGY